MAKQLTTIDAVIDELGGTNAMAHMMAAPKSAVSNWRRDKQFPANTYLAIMEALKAKRLTAAPGLWPMRKLVRDGG